jgi:hypothetical protein
MAKQQMQITEGEGLLESRLNQDFIEWLKRWGFWILLVAAIASLSYAGVKELERRQLANLDSAFRAYQAAVDSGSPDSLLAVASDHSGRGAVAELATMDAADIYLRSARAGVLPGGTSGVPEDMLDDNGRRDMATRAGGLYEQVLNRTAGNDAQIAMNLGAEWGMAAVDVINRDFDAARQRLQSVASRAEAAGLTKMHTVVLERIAALDELELAAPLPSDSDLPARPQALQPTQAPDPNAVPDLLQAPPAVDDGSSSEFSPFVDPSLDNLRVPKEEDEGAESEPSTDPPAETPAEPPAEEEEGEGGGGSGEG